MSDSKHEHETFDFEGKTVALLGRLYEASADLRYYIEQLDGWVTRTVSTRTDVVFAGLNPSEKGLSRARLLNVPVYHQQTLRELLEDKEVQWRPFFDDEPKEEYPDTLESFEEILHQAREIVGKGESRETWEQLCELLDASPDSSHEVLLEYLLPHTEHWRRSGWVDHGPRDKNDLRSQPQGWLQSMIAGEDLPKYAMVRVLDLRGKKLPGKVILNLARLSHLSHLRDLYLAGNRPSVALIRDLRSEELLPALEHLSLSTISLREQPKVVEQLAQITHWSALTHLALSRCELEYYNVDALCEAELLKGLTHLDLSGNIPQSVNDALKQWAPQLQQLEALHLGSLRFGHSNDFSMAFYQRLNTFPQLKVLAVPDCYFTTDQLAMLQEASFVRLHSLDLSNTYFGQRGVFQALEQASFARSLTSLKLVSCELGKGEVRDLVEGPLAPQLEELDLSHSLRSGDIQHILDAEHMVRLKRLRLANASLNERAFTTLLRAPHLRQLEEFTVSHIHPRVQNPAARLEEATELNEVVRGYLLGLCS